MAARYPSPTNVFVPSFEASGAVIAFIRNPEKFKFNRYVEKRPTTKPIGLYLKLDPDQPTRVVTDAEFAWQDGDERPAGNNNLGNFEFADYRTERRDYPWTLGWQTIRNADWKVKAFQSQIVMMQAMTLRTWRMVTVLETAGNWGSNTATANVLNGGAGTWETASDDPTDPNYLAITKSLDEAVRRVFLATNGCVGWEDLRLVISPGLAIKMSNTPEIKNYLRESRFAMAQITGETKNVNKTWGLPTHYDGIEIVVEDAVRTTTRPNTLDTRTKVFIKADSSAVLMSRVGGLDGGEVGTGSYSTVQWFYYSNVGELQVQTFEDVRNERTEGHVVEQFAEELAAPASGFLITGTV